MSWTAFTTSRAPGASGGEHVVVVPNPEDKPIKAIRVIDQKTGSKIHLSGDRYSAEYDLNRMQVRLTFRTPVDGEIAL